MSHPAGDAFSAPGVAGDPSREFPGPAAGVVRRSVLPLFIESDVIADGDIEKSLVIGNQHRGTRSAPTCVVRAIATSIGEGGLCREVREIRNGPPDRTVAVGD